MAADAPEQQAHLALASTTSQTMAASRWSTLNPKQLKLKSAAVLVLDQDGEEVYSRHVSEPRPIASITKHVLELIVLLSFPPDSTRQQGRHNLFSRFFNPAIGRRLLERRRSCRYAGSTSAAQGRQNRFHRPSGQRPPADIL